MTGSTTLNDSPVKTPAEDRYGFDPFARALARGIAGVATPEGTVLAINGPWGSGKSSAINLVLYHLRDEITAGRIEVVSFSPWWFAGPEALTRAFFEALAAALGSTLRGNVKKKAKEALNAVFERVRPGKQVGAVGADVATGGLPVGTATVAAMDLGVEYLNAKRSIEEEYERLAEALRDQRKRVLVVVDDIDRLDAGDAMLIFRLIKSVGRLPNVVYLLAFHAEVADRHLRRRFDTSASEYLEKVVQVSYELPVPARPLVLRALLTEVNGILPPSDAPGAMTRFGNLFHDCVAPWLATPRDVVRLANAVRVGWPAVAGEVDGADFLALEAMKLAHPGVYRAVQANPQTLCGLERMDGSGHRGRDDAAARYDAMLLAMAPEADRDRLRIALRRLFPRLDAAWGNLWRDHATAQEWRRRRFVCAREHFDTYFLLAPGENVIPAAEMSELLQRLGDAEYVRATLLRASATRRRLDGCSQASLLLDELRLHARDIQIGDVPALLAALSNIADDLDVPEDDVSGGVGWGNQLRLWRLIGDLTRGRLDREARSGLLLDAVRHAQVGWLSWLADLCREEHQPGKEGEAEGDRDPIVTLAAAEVLRATSLEAIRAAARTGSLLPHPKLWRLLFTWAECAGDDGAQVRRWTDALLDDDEAVAKLAQALMSLGESFAIDSHGFLGDRVPTKVPQVDRAALVKICDAGRLVARVEELLAHADSPESNTALKQFLVGIRRGSDPTFGGP